MDPAPPNDFTGDDVTLGTVNFTVWLVSTT